jgi:hypothetical protein
MKIVIKTLQGKQLPLEVEEGFSVSRDNFLSDLFEYGDLSLKLKFG